MEDEVVELTPIDNVYTKDESIVLTFYRFIKEHYELVIGIIVGLIIGVLIGG